MRLPEFLRPLVTKEALIGWLLAFHQKVWWLMQVGGDVDFVATYSPNLIVINFTDSWGPTGPRPLDTLSGDDAVPTIRERVLSGSTIYADEAACWDTLHARYETKRINHSVAFKDKGACTNQAESFFSRLRRAEIGINHRISGQYLSAYASEMAWREDNRRLSNGEQYLITAGAALAHGVSRQWKGYWQRMVHAGQPYS